MKLKGLLAACAALLATVSMQAQTSGQGGGTPGGPSIPPASQRGQAIARAAQGPPTVLGQPVLDQNTYTWGAFDHSGWKGMTNYPLGYVIVGGKFFEPANTSIFVTGFDDLSQHQFTREHPSGFTSLQTFWKSFTTIGNANNPSGFFIASAGTRKGSSHYYTLQVDKAGKFIQERFGPLASGIQFGGACQSNDGGYVVVGSNGSGNVVALKFNAAGELQSTTELSFDMAPISAFAWTVQRAPGGGYVVGGTTRALRIDNDFNVEWSIPLGLPLSPDGSAYTYTEFEEIIPLDNTGTGFAQTGSAFSNSTSAVYTMRVGWDGKVAWRKINDSSNTALPGTPVRWANSAVEHFSPSKGEWDILTTWRAGPVSGGGLLMAERMDPSDGGELQEVDLNSAVPVQEAFTIRQPFLNRIIVAGTRGGYSAVFSYSGPPLP